MTHPPDAVVIGGGIIGASIAHQIVRRSDLRVVVLEKGSGPGEGSTGASSSIVRCRYTHPEMIRLALDGLEAFRRWGRFTGLDRPRAELYRTGFLWMSDLPAAEVEADAARLRVHGVEATVLDPGGLAERFPALSPCVAPLDLETDHECRPGEAFLLEEGAGYVDPMAALEDLHEALVSLGGELRFRSRVVEIRRRGGRVTGVQTSDGEVIHTGLVVNAAGPWCDRVNQLAGLDHRWTLVPTRIQTLYRWWPEQLGPLPTGTDPSTGIYYRPEGRRVMVGSVLPEDEEEAVADPDHFRRVPDPWFRELKMAAFHHRVPELPARGGVSGIAGLYTVNREDVHPIVGPSGVDGFWLANGFSGHGFKLAPMIGSMIAQAVTGVRVELDTEVPMSFLGVDRPPLAVAVKHVLA